ncbi:MAG TPA: hypothetical protein VEQ63_03525 [Bryobacteraceae bacterium]|nr:hypothetical protein [Bryobacteraceae bacterium]
MRCLCLVLALSSADGAPADSAPKLPPREKALITEAYTLWSAVANEIWPGTSSLKAPLIYVAEQHEYAIGFQRSLEGFTDTRDSVVGMSVQVRNRSFALDLSASFPVQGIPAVVMGSPEALGKPLGSWVITAGHEMFHVFQSASGSYDKAEAVRIGPKGDSSWHLTFPFPYDDRDAMRLIHLQGYLVWLAAQSSSQDDAKYSVGTAVEAAHVYRAYLAHLTGDEKAYRYSQFQEWNEGVAAYFEYRLAEKAAAGAYQPTEEYSSLPMFQRYDALWREAYQARPFLSKHAGRAAKGRTAFYHLGTGKALALDKVDAGWKKRYFLPGIWLDDLLAAAK